ncbi:hypothetical protein B0H13DRAFT_2370901 [Mycena leptocephala]|nr:hypothetical protein B0H13DRAFT_2370901 [Mycena leptocephala]
MNKFIAWIIRTEATATFVVTALSLRSLADWHLTFFWFSYFWSSIYPSPALNIIPFQVIWRPRLSIFIALMIGLAHLFSIPLWPGSAPARPTQGQLHSSPFDAPACGQSQSVYHVHRDFEPFYELAEHHPTFFPDMLERAMRIADDDGGLCLTTFNIKNHKSLVNKMAPMLPDMGLIFNYQDEPRVLFNTRRPDAYEFALNKSDQNPFRQGPRPTKEYYQEDSRHQCLLPNSEKGFAHTRLVPNPEPSAVDFLFADIVVPSLYYLWVRHGFEDNVRWEDKKSQIYWRGSTSGGSLDRETYHSFPRFRLIDKSLRRPDIMDVGITKLHNCDPDPNNPTHAVCPEEEIKAEYNVETPSQPLEEVSVRKLLLMLTTDVEDALQIQIQDGNSFSQCYLSLLRSGSLVFKSSTFSEFFDDWLKSYVHYIPVLPDLSDLERKIMWAIENDDEARQIQANGLEYATRVLTEKQSMDDCNNNRIVAPEIHVFAPPRNILREYISSATENR